QSGWANAGKLYGCDDAALGQFGRYSLTIGGARMKYPIFVYPVVKFIIIFLLLSGCSTAMPVPTPEDDRSVTTRILASRSPSTRTPLPATETPLLVPDPTPIITISSVPPSVTPNPIPTPPGDEATQQVLWLFETNNGC